VLAHGSGFLAVLVAGIVVGDVRAPYKAEIEGFHAALASLAEIVAFGVLGLTVSLSSFVRGDAWLVGLGLAVVLALVIRPVLVDVCSSQTLLVCPEDWSASHVRPPPRSPAR
jgi:cell volume regulation protein A